jgi:hypothetical protein
VTHRTDLTSDRDGTKGTTMRRLMILALAAVAVLALAGCSEKYNAEREGKDLGKAVCDLRDAETEQEVEEARAKVDEELDNLIEDYAFMTADDREALEGQFAQLQENVGERNFGLAQQDLALMQATVTGIRENVNEVSRAAWDGFQQGLSECTS